jgi:hypothetical protein
MLKSISTGACILGASLGFIGGMKVQESRSRHSKEASESSVNSRVRPANERPLQRSSTAIDAERLRSAVGDDVAAIAQPILRVGPQVDRLRRFLAMLDGLTPENWQKLLTTMAEETSKNGRFQQQEWDLTLRQAGRIDGARAAAVHAERGDDNSLRKVLAGWAQTDPEAAWKWLGTYKDEAGRRDVWRGALIGLAELDPNEAMRRLDSLPFEVKGGTISFLVSPMIQAEGIDATAERIKGIYADYKAKDSSSISAKEHEFVYAFFHNVCDIKRNAGYTPEKRMEALELLAGFPDLARRSPWLIPRTVASTPKDDPARTMELVQQMTVEDGELLNPEGVDQTAKVWLEKDPAGFREWIRTNRGNPAADHAAKYLPTAQE